MAAVADIRCAGAASLHLAIVANTFFPTNDLKCLMLGSLQVTYLVLLLCSTVPHFVLARAALSGMGKHNTWILQHTHNISGLLSCMAVSLGQVRT